MNNRYLLNGRIINKFSKPGEKIEPNSFHKVCRNLNISKIIERYPISMPIEEKSVHDVCVRRIVFFQKKNRPVVFGHKPDKIMTEELSNNDIRAYFAHGFQKKAGPRFGFHRRKN